MNLDKAEIQLLVLNNQGADVEDSLEEANKDLLKYTGGKSALLQAKEKIELLHENVKKDNREGRLKACPDPTDVEKVIHEWITHVTIALEQLAVAADMQMIRNQARAEAFEEVMLKTGKKIANIKGKVKAYQKALESGEVEMSDVDGTVIPLHKGDPKRRPSGTHPGNPLTARKKAADETGETAEEEPKKEAKSEPKATAKPAEKAEKTGKKSEPGRPKRNKRKDDKER